MNRLAALLGDDRPVLFDGGMGTLLQDSGLEDGAPGELWNLENPDAIRAAHTAYADAGARILTTNTFGGTRPRLDMHGLGDRLHEVNEQAARIARSVADGRGLLVAGDLGPTGELLAPLGAMTPAEAQELFAEQLRGLLAGGIDLVLVETLSDLGEADAALAAARAVAPDLPVVVTMSFDTNLRTMMGVRPADAAARCRRGGGQLRSRAHGDGGHRRGDGGRPPRRGAARRAVQRRPPAGGGRPLRVRRQRGGHGRARDPPRRDRRRPGGRVLRLDAHAHRRDDGSDRFREVPALIEGRRS